MERHDNNSVLEESKSTGISFFQSAHFKLLIFGAILLIYGIIFSILFASNTMYSSSSMQNIISLQTDYYAGYATLSPMHLNLSNYMNLHNEDYFNRYEKSKGELFYFIELLASADLDVYSHDLAQLCEKYIQAADQAIIYSKQSNSELMETYFNEAERIKTLITLFSPYTNSEINGIISGNLTKLNTGMFEQLRYTIALFALTTILIIIAAAMFVRYFISPMKGLTSLVQNISIEQWEIQPPPNAPMDEAGLLIRFFYKMLNVSRGQYDQLLHKQQLERDLQNERERSIRSEALLAKSQLQVFQSQINSHFLFNTLNILSRLAYIEHAPRVQNATNLLAKFLRTTLNQFDQVIPLSDEFDNVENYIDIQKLRFGERIQFESEMDIDLEWFEIPAMTIQPLVENAFRHGLSEKKSGFIKYAAQKVGSSMEIYSWDDGKGISDERQREIMELFQSDDINMTGKDCIGLYNVYSRLNLCYPNKVVPKIESKLGIYTKIGFIIDLS